MNESTKLRECESRLHQAESAAERHKLSAMQLQMDLEEAKLLGVSCRIHARLHGCEWCELPGCAIETRVKNAVIYAPNMNLSLLRGERGKTTFDYCFHMSSLETI